MAGQVVVAPGPRWASLPAELIDPLCFVRDPPRGRALEPLSGMRV